MSSDSIRAELEEELSRLIATEKEIDSELSQYFNVIAEGKSVSTGLSYESSSDLTHSLSKVEQFAPCFEVMTQGSHKLVNQIEECRNLSDRLSVMVRRLDTIQTRAQEALACTEDVINMKECKIGIMTAIENLDLPLAVSFIKQVHAIDKQAAKASDDYLAILEAEKEVCSLVRAEFETAIQSSNIDKVLALCPLLQTVGLEVEARDTFMSFMEANVFISLSSDAAAIDSTDHATAYAQSLASIFNNACLIFQQYLPVVIQGMAKSDGDMVFIRCLHAKCSKESGLVLKRYMKFRNVKNCIAAATASSSVLSRMSNSRKRPGGGAAGQVSALPSPAEMHQLLDEIAIILQYCCSYAEYVALLCTGAESRPRALAINDRTGSGSGSGNHSASDNSSIMQKTKTGRVFSGPCDFDQMVDELINSYYVEGEHWLMLWGIECVTKAEKKRPPRSSAVRGVGTASEGTADDDDDDDDGDYDGCFFVLQRCSQRAIATSNIQAACAVLHFMADHLSNDLLQHLTLALDAAVDGLATYVTEVMQNILKTSSSGGRVAKVQLSMLANLSLSKGIQNVFSSRLSPGVTGSVGSGSGTTVASSSGGAGGEQQQESLQSGPAAEVAAMEIFNSVEQCARYTTSLRREILASSREVFGEDVHSGPEEGRGGARGAENANLAKISMCLDNFDECRECFMQAISASASSLAATCGALMSEVLNKILGQVHFEFDGDRFESQEVVQMVPKALVGPFDVLIRMCTEALSDSNKDLLIGLLVNAYTISVESFICKTSFSFAGSIKLEECVRALNNSFSQLSSVSLRAKFSRLREVLIVLTADSLPLLPSSSAVATSALALTQLHNLSQLTESEARAFVALRSDLSDE